MNDVIQYFQNIPSWHRILLLAGGISLFWLLESAIPLFQFTYNKWKHAGVNIFFTITTLVINFGFALLTVVLSDWCLKNGFGILQWINMPPWLQVIVGLMLLDLVGAWLIHYIQHKIKWMWKFHMIHHADTHVDTTTANRHHPGESVLRAIFTLIGVIVLGVPMWVVMMYQSLSVVLTQFNHANIRLPLWMDNAISWF